MVDISKNVYVGIDPGKYGAIFIIFPNGYTCYDAPSEPKEILEFCRKLYNDLSDYKNKYVLLERSMIYGGQGSASSRTTILNFGYWEMALLSAGFNPETVMPKTWQANTVGKFYNIKIEGLSRYERRKKIKDYVISYATLRYPNVKFRDVGARGGNKDYDGRADASCIAEYCKIVNLYKGE